MARIYAGIFGPLAFLVSLMRGIIHGGGTETVLQTAWCCLLAFAAAGYVMGRLAEWITEDSLNSRLTAELSARQTARGTDSARNETKASS